MALALLSACVADDQEMLDVLRQIPDRMAEVLKMSDDDRARGRALSLHEGVRRDRPRLQLRHGVRDWR